MLLQRVFTGVSIQIQNLQYLTNMEGIMEI